MTSETAIGVNATVGDAVRAGNMNRRAWTVVALLVLLQLIAFGDKAVLGLVAEDMMSELDISPTTFGLIGSSLYLFYAVGAVVGGFASKRYSVRWIILVIAMLWALTQFPIFLGGGLAVIFVSRIVLGAAEGPATPMSLASVHEWFAPSERALPSSVIAATAALGPVIAAPLITWIIIVAGWRWAFGALGIVGLLWLGAWMLVRDDGPYSPAKIGTATDVAEAKPGADQPTPKARSRSHPSDSFANVPWPKIVFSASFLAASIAGFSNFWTQGFLTTWSPQYLRNVIGLSTAEVGFASALPWMFGAILLIVLGLYGRRVMRKGHGARIAFAIPFAGSALIAGVAFLLLPLTSGMLSVCLLIVAAGCSIVYPLLPSGIAFAVSPSQRAFAMSCLSGLACLGALAAPTVVGMLMESAGYVAPKKGDTANAEAVASMTTGINTSFVVAGIILLVAAALAFTCFKPDQTGMTLQKRHTGTARDA